MGAWASKLSLQLVRVLNHGGCLSAESDVRKAVNAHEEAAVLASHGNEGPEQCKIRRNGANCSYHLARKDGILTKSLWTRKFGICNAIGHSYENRLELDFRICCATDFF